MLIYLIECTGQEQAEEITTTLFKENLVIRVYKINDIKISSCLDDAGNETRQGTMLIALSKALLFNEIEEKVASFDGTFVTGLPVSALNWEKVRPFMELTKKV